MTIANDSEIMNENEYQPEATIARCTMYIQKNV